MSTIIIFLSGVFIGAIAFAIAKRASKAGQPKNLETYNSLSEVDSEDDENL